MISISDPVPSGWPPAVRPGRRRQPARPARPPHLAADRHRTTPRRLPHPGTPPHLPDRRPAPPGTHPGRRAARHRRPLVGGPGSADQRPGPRHPQPQPRAAVGAAAPLRHTPDPHRRPRPTAPRARRPGCPSHRVRPLAGPDLRPDPARGRRPAAARADLRNAQMHRPNHDTADLAVLHRRDGRHGSTAHRTAAAPTSRGDRPRRADRRRRHCRPNRRWRHSPAWPGAPRCSNATTGPRPAPNSTPRWTWAAATASTT